jgi:putative heme-binding domain-containing protein
MSLSKIVALALLLSLLGATQPLVPAQENSSTDVDSDATRRAMEQAALIGAGNARIGKELFFKDNRTKCAVCHRVGKTGGEVGPDLSAIGGKFDRPHLIESLLQPSRQIVQGYETTSVLTASGQVINGVVKERSERRIRLLDAEGRTVEVAASEVDQQRTSDVSLMPTGLATGLSTQEFIHLIAYLESLGGGGNKFGAGIHGPIRLPDGFAIETVATGLSGAVAMETTQDGRVLICEQTGALRVVRDGQLLDQPFLTLPVHVEWERGLIGVTVDPEFDKRPYVYVCYVAKDPYPHHVVSRLLADGDVAAAGSEQVLIRGDDQRKLGGNVPAGHQGGAVHFGDDGCLYIGIGEQTAKQPSQKLDTFQGKLLRIHSDGTIPRDNPFHDQTSGKYRAIWAYGLRNPFTFAFDPDTGDLLINDVGGNFEEINRGKAGANYGWPIAEHGPTQDPRFVGPIHIYPQSSIGGSVFVPQDSPWPETYRGKYLFADFVLGWIHMIDPIIDDNGADNVDASEARTFAEGLRRPVDMRLSAEGDLYVLLRNAWVIDDKFEGGTGSLLKITYRPEH